MPGKWKEHIYFLPKAKGTGHYTKGVSKPADVPRTVGVSGAGLGWFTKTSTLAHNS